jgi:hypothetical protein
VFSPIELDVRLAEWEAIACKHLPHGICIACGNQTASIARGRINEFRSAEPASAVSVARPGLNSLSNTRASHISGSPFAVRCE